MTPRVSIIVPVYNVEKYLCPCLDSIGAQTFTDFEAVLVDDGSTDNSGEICDEYAAKDTRFVVVHKQNEGVAKARITAFEHSKGELVTFIDSDDIVDSSYLEKLYNPIVNNSVGITCCQVTRVIGSKRNKEDHSIIGTYDKNGIRNFVKHNYLHDTNNNKTGIPLYLCGKLYKRKYIEDGLKAGLGLRLGEDQIALFYMLQKIDQITIIPDYLYDYIRHEGQASAEYKQDFWDNQIEVFRRYIELDKEGLLGNQLPLRMWRVLINGIEGKMLPTLSSYRIFKRTVVPILTDDIFQSLFHQDSLQLGFKKNIKFWMLKYRQYFMYYVLFIRPKR